MTQQQCRLCDDGMDGIHISNVSRSKHLLTHIDCDRKRTHTKLSSKYDKQRMGKNTMRFK